MKPKEFIESLNDTVESHPELIYKKDSGMKCLICHENFNPALLSEVFEHEHSGIKTLDAEITGVQTGKTYRENESENVAEIAFCRTNNHFDVTYKNGNTYRYFNFPVLLFEEAVYSCHIGRFLAERVKGEYRYHQLN